MASGATLSYTIGRPILFQPPLPVGPHPAMFRVRVMLCLDVKDGRGTPRTPECQRVGGRRDLPSPAGGG
jgi:hypothetical protein